MNNNDERPEERPIHHDRKTKPTKLDERTDLGNSGFDNECQNGDIESS